MAIYTLCFLSIAIGSFKHTAVTPHFPVNIMRFIEQTKYNSRIISINLYCIIPEILLLFCNSIKFMQIKYYILSA